jgi:transposase
LTPGQAGDGEGRKLIEAMGGPQEAGEVALLMDSAYEGNATQELAQRLGFVPVVPLNPNRRQPHKLDKALYRRRNEVERMFRRLKAWRRVFTRYDKTDVMFAAFITVALIAEALRLHQQTLVAVIAPQWTSPAHTHVRGPGYYRNAGYARDHIQYGTKRPKKGIPMMNTTLEQLCGLKLNGMAASLQDQLTQAGMTVMSFEERLALLVGRKVYFRNDKR